MESRFTFAQKLAAGFAAVVVVALAVAAVLLLVFPLTARSRSIARGWRCGTSTRSKAITNARWLGAVTPLGGISFIVGWCWLMICAGKGSRTKAP